MATYTCHKCPAREMSRCEYIGHLATVHNLALRIGRRVLAMVVA